MKNNLTCEVVEDLMPSYIDGLTCEVTNKAVREHLSISVITISLSVGIIVTLKVFPCTSRS